MLYFIAAWTVLWVGCGVVGIALLQWCKTESFVRVGDRLIAAEWLGLIVLAISLLAVSIFMPLHPAIGIGVMLVWVTMALLSRSVRLELTGLMQQLSWRHLLGYFAIVIVLSSAMAQPVTWIDSGLYHYGSIQWLEQYGTVTGITLIFSNLGFVSAWFALAAPFNPPSLDARVSAVTNGFVLLVVGIQLGVYLIHSLRGKARPSDGFGIVFFGLMLAAVPLYSLFQDIAISPSPDLPSIFLVGVVPWSMLVITNAPTHSPPAAAADLPRTFKGNDPIVPLLLAVGAVSIKLTAMSLLLISGLFYLVQSRRSLRQLCIGGAIGLVLLAPLLLAGIKASGCPLYPSSVLCLDVPWAQNQATLSAVSRGTYGWTNWYGPPPAGQNPLLWVAGKWLQSERTNQAIAALIGFTVVASVASVKLLLESQIRGKLWVAAIGGMGTGFLLMTAPFFRFILPYLVLMPSLLGMVWGAQLGLPAFYGMVYWLHRSPLFSRSDRVLRLAAFTGITASLGIFMHTNPALHLLLPPPMQTVPVVQKRVNDLTYFSPQKAGELCWATPLPCGFEIEQVRLRDADRGLAGGFVRED